VKKPDAELFTGSWFFSKEEKISNTMVRVCLIMGIFVIGKDFLKINMNKPRDGVASTLFHTADR